MPPVHQEQVEEQVEEEAEQQAVQQAWLGGPIDTSLLTRYEHHVARHVWFGQERVEGDKIELRIVSLGRKLADRIPDHHPQVIQGWLNISGLCWLERTSLKFTDPQLISAFVERWHPETSSFHMPFGEMTITLDDVACLLHLPVRGQFYTPVSVSQEQAAELAVELLGEEYEFALRETVAQRGGYFSQQWLYESYNRNANFYGKYDCAARAWMLMLVGSTILADKSYTRVDAKWLLLFSDLSAVHTYSWANIALVCLYDNLNDASMFSTRALAGYATLLQVCDTHYKDII
ncbi:protein MAIN-LIKE 1-like [Trifolium pratense]|uniref:protein MAIN-LIKE 1-like n=1 Tax=Trifolium pratense TaxID=57577 RepID=UPI001E694910|nr:protein MAIN-LIKE 1-like [Trifolium pratense]